MGASFFVFVASVSVTLRAKAHAQGSDHDFGASVSVTLRARAHAPGSGHGFSCDLLAAYRCIEQLIQPLIFAPSEPGLGIQISGGKLLGLP